MKKNIRRQAKLFLISSLMYLIMQLIKFVTKMMIMMLSVQLSCSHYSTDMSQFISLNSLTSKSATS